MASLKLKSKVLLRSRSLEFTREYFKRDGEGSLRTYDWNGVPVAYRSGTSDTGLIYNILLKRGRKSEYAPPPEAGLQPHEVKVVLDIGANIGIAALYFARSFPDAVVHAFEPVPGNCEVLRANARSLARIQVHPFALGAEDGALDLFDSDDKAHLVRLNVFYQVAHWRCRYCGHSNSRSFDNMKIKNTCDICATEYFAPIDIEWQYELNDFVYRSLHRHSGLPVLWTLGFLQDRMHAGSFWYLPEVDLYESDDDPESKNEVDILAMIDGAFYAVEAKLSASIFLNKAGSIDKFVKMVGLLRPDVALLAFDKFCAEEEDVEATKAKLAEAGKLIRERIGPWTKLEILVAQDVHGFNDFPADLGWHGRRVRKYH